MAWTKEKRWNLWKSSKRTIMFEWGISTEPYWSELQTKGYADRFRSFSVVSICWDRMEFNKWGVAQGPAIKLVFCKFRLWFITNRNWVDSNGH